MGTNYYLREDACEHCGRSDNELHIGKSSFGWCFSLHVDASEGLNSLDDWKARLDRGGLVFDEYGSEIPKDALLSLITNRGTGKHPENFDYSRNSAMPGPNGTIRHVIDGRHCVGHGEGTWDLMAGEFS